MSVAEKIMSNEKVHPSIVSIEVGYGSTTLVYSANGKHMNSMTMPSPPKQLGSRSDLTGGLLVTTGKSAVVIVNDNEWQVGTDVGLSSERKSVEVLNDNYIDSDEYLAMFLGCLSLQPHDEIDMLALALPVNRMHLKPKLEAMAKNIKIGQRHIAIRNVWIVSQPFAGLLYHVYESSPETGLRSLINKNFLVIDIGYLTLDWLSINNMRPDEKLSGAIELGMSVLVHEIAEYLGSSKVFDIGEVSPAIINKAFETGSLSMFGKTFNFPIHKSETVSFDASKLIASHMEKAANKITNVIGKGASLDGIVVVGGASGLLLDHIQRRFKHHAVVSYGIDAVGKGLQYGGALKANSGK